jgi:PAS domain S-box-containing protein
VYVIDGSQRVVYWNHGAEKITGLRTQEMLGRPCAGNLGLDHIEMTVTAEGLRIELMESEAGTFFESGNPVPTPNGREFLIALAQQLGQLPNKISIAGHTDAKAVYQRAELRQLGIVSRSRQCREAVDAR